MTLKRPRSIYTEDIMANAIIDVTKNGLSRYRAAQKYDIPQQSISDRLKGQVALADQIQPRQLLIRSACVEALIKQLNNERTVGRNWVSKFINRHPDIKNKRGRRQEANRFNAFTPRAVHWFFDIREKEYGWIKPENTVNVDEGGIMSGFGLDSLVGKELQKQWFLTEFGKIADWHYITSPNGWTDNHIAIEWLERMDMEVMQRMHGWPHAF
ncbi:helix-turn-helix, psq domain-containing protein [Hirsutella rhossiliensis]